MRFREIVLHESNYNDELVSEIISLLSAISAEGINEINIVNLLKDLTSEGHPLDEQSLKDLLGELAIVTDVSDDGIVSISTSTTDDGFGDEFGGEMPDEPFPGDDEEFPGPDDGDVDELEPGEMDDELGGGMPPEDEMDPEAGDEEEIDIDDENYSTKGRISALARKKATDDLFKT